MSIEALRKDFFWHSYFRNDGGVKVWVSFPSPPLNLISTLAGTVLLAILYFTLGAAIALSFKLTANGFLLLLIFFLGIYIFLVLLCSFLFFRGLFSSAKVTCSGASFTIEYPKHSGNRIGFFLFAREKKSVNFRLASIGYARVLFDVFAEGANFFYTVDFAFENGEVVKFPLVYTASDTIAYYTNLYPHSQLEKFGHFTLTEVERIAAFFGVPLVKRY